MTGPRGDGVGETLRFQVCGPVAVTVGGHRVEAELPGRQGRVLLAHLVVHRLRPADRDRLVADLWPAGPPSGADQALRSLLSRLRRALGAELVAGRAAPPPRLPAHPVLLPLAAAARARRRTGGGRRRAAPRLAGRRVRRSRGGARGAAPRRGGGGRRRLG